MTKNDNCFDHCCEEMIFFLNEKKVPISYSPRFREYSILLRTGGTARQIIQYCPWCGKKLPTSLRDQCADELKNLGLNIFDDNIPDMYKTDEWWHRKCIKLK